VPLQVDWNKDGYRVVVRNGYCWLRILWKGIGLEEKRSEDTKAGGKEATGP
jgi:hypothetical protein